MPAPKNPESYSTIYYEIAQFTKEYPLENLTFSFGEERKALTFRRNLYGYITALSRAMNDRMREKEEKELLRRDLNALRARKITLEKWEEEIKVHLIPRDTEELSEEISSQLQQKREELGEDKEEEEEGEPEGDPSNFEETLQERLRGGKEES